MTKRKTNDEFESIPHGMHWAVVSVGVGGDLHYRNFKNKWAMRRHVDSLMMVDGVMIKSPPRIKVLHIDYALHVEVRPSLTCVPAKRRK